MMPLRVLVLATSYPSEARPADGIFIHTQCHALAQLGVDVRVLNPIPWVPRLMSRLRKRWDCYHNLPALRVWDGVEVSRPRYLAFPRANYWYSPHWHYARAAEQRRGFRPDLIHAHMGYPAGLAGVVVARRWGIPSIVTLHGGDVNSAPGKSLLYRLHIKSALKRATGLIAVSKALAEKAEQLAGRRPCVLPIGIDLAKFAQFRGKENARRELGLPVGKKLLLYAGALLAAKGIPEIGELMSGMDTRDVALVIIGDGPLESMARNIKGAICTGVVPNDLIAHYMRAADLLLLPSHEEGMPTVLVEAGAADLPIIASDVGGIPELLCDGRGWVVPRGSVPALKDAVARALADPSEAALRSSRLRELVLRDYDVRQNAKKLLALYAETIGEFRRDDRRCAS